MPLTISLDGVMADRRVLSNLWSDACSNSPEISLSRLQPVIVALIVRLLRIAAALIYQHRIPYSTNMQLQTDVTAALFCGK